MSTPFFLRHGAEAYGHEHRLRRHDGMHPINEGILTAAGRMPQVGEWRVIALVVALVLIGLIAKAAGIG
ncbi:hypothetical protein ABZ682_22840 [Streptomyces griseoviridis]|uniref:hypothetical protein n=1 Tax=Streptomyces griseoviridis TaxID=45398 RepID=UPI0033D82C90